MAMDLVGKRQANGTIDGGKTAIYRARAPGILTLWQNTMAKSSDIYSIFEISNSPIPSLFGLISGFDIQEYAKTQPLSDLIFEAVGKAQSYCFETDGQGICYVEDYANGIWNILATINMTSTANSVSTFSQYKGAITPTVGATKSRLRFSGPYFYRTINRALFGIPLDPAKIPDYKPWFKVTMPADFKSVETIIDEVPDRQYTREIGTKWEGRRDLYVNYYFVGKVRIVYKPVPVTITALTQTLQADEISSMSGAYFLSATLLLIEDPASASYFQQMYESMKLESQLKQPSSESAIVDIYSINMAGG